MSSKYHWTQELTNPQDRFRLFQQYLLKHVEINSKHLIILNEDSHMNILWHEYEWYTIMIEGLIVPLIQAQ